MPTMNRNENLNFSTHRCHNSATNIPANVLNNFKPFDILEPQKLREEPPVGKLIEIENQNDIHLPESSNNVVENKEFDLVDLLQNIYVSPQHIKTTKTVRQDIDIDLKEFLNKMEFSCKDTKELEAHSFSTKPVSDDIYLKGNFVETGLNLSTNSSIRTTEHSPKDNFEIATQINKDEFPKTKVLVPKAHNGVTENNFETKCQINDDGFPKPRVLIPKIDLEPDFDTDDVIDEIFTTKYIEQQMGVKTNANNDYLTSSSSRQAKADYTEKNVTFYESEKTFESPKHDLLHTKEGTNTLNCQQTNRFKEIGKSKTISNKSTNLVNNDAKILFATKILNPEPKSTTNINKHLFQLHERFRDCGCEFKPKTAIIDQKLYRRNREVKTKEEKAKYTKGATFNEKKVVLPQLIKRLKESAGPEKDAADKKYLLDVGGTKDVSNEKISQSEESFESTYINDILGVASDLAEPGNSNFGDVNMSKLGGISEPHILLEDCNRLRLLAWKRGRFMNEFVRTGQYKP